MYHINITMLDAAAFSVWWFSVALFFAVMFANQLRCMLGILHVRYSVFGTKRSHLVILCKLGKWFFCKTQNWDNFIMNLRNVLSELSAGRKITKNI